MTDALSVLIWIRTFDSLIKLLKDFFKKIILKKVISRQQSMKNNPACEGLTPRVSVTLHGVLSKSIPETTKQWNIWYQVQEK